MKRVISIVLVMCLMAACLSACGKKTDNKPIGEAAPIASEDEKIDPSTETEPAKDAEPANDAEPSNDSAQAETVPADTSDTSDGMYDKYLAFINGDEKVDCYGSLTSFQELLDVVAVSFYAGDDDKAHVDKASYAWIDCGLDGVPEMAITFTVTDPYQTEYESIYIIKEIDNVLKVCDFIDYGYRAYASINKAGVVQYSGSNGAMSHGFDVWFYNADGEYKLDYNSNSNWGLWGIELPEGYSLGEEYADYMDSFYVESYSFEPYYYDETTYNDHLLNMKYIYSIVDEDYNIVDDPFIYDNDNEYRKVWDATGLPFVMKSTLDELIEEHEKQIGLTKEMYSADEPEWNEMEVPEV